jgi:uncharacterized protein YecE (DUF72 family)
MERESPAQQELFGSPQPEQAAELVRPAPVPEEVIQVARRLPKNLHLGTSSWSFPGWVGIVYAQLYTTAVLARYGLAAYSQHPLLNAVNLDSTFYRTVTAEELARYAAEVPESFRFIVKAYAGLTASPQSAVASRRGIEPVFLDAAFASRAVVQPLVKALGSRLGALLFQFSPLGPRYTRAPSAFIRELGAFLRALPAGPLYAVELRNEEILGAEYEAMLEEAGAVHCCNVHSRMPAVDQQVRAHGERPLLVRWMLHPEESYASAAQHYAPFDRLAAPDELNRGRIVAMVRQALTAGREVHVTAANNAEGSAPLTLWALAKSLDAALVDT